MFLRIDLGSEEYVVEEYEGYLGPIDLGVDMHLHVYESYKHDVYDPRNIVVVGKGPFAGGGLFGAHRMIMVFRSPLTKGLHVSAIGGAAYRFLGTGVDGLIVEGRSRDPSVLLVKGRRDGVEVDFQYMDLNELFKIYWGYDGFKGVRALTKYLVGRFERFFREHKARMMLVGPASFKTSMGAVCSPSIDYASLKVRVEDWGARGGGGSVLARSHNLAAIVFGGERKVDGGLSRFDYANGVVTFLSGYPYVRAVIEATRKYTYDPKTRTGGTFGGDLTGYRDKVPSFNWRSVGVGKEVREKIFRLLVSNYLEPFNKEFIEGAFWRTCDEPCPVSCKKTTEDGRHVDYEPFLGCGPMIGVFDLREAFEIVDLVDELGYDAIEVGNLLGWVFEVVEKGLLKPEEIGLNAKPVVDPLKWEPSVSSVNKEIALRVLEEMVYGDNKLLRLIAEKGLRAAAKRLDELFADRVEALGFRFEDLGVYVPYGVDGHITPNYYWSPGVFAPLAVLGRYWTLYSPVFLDPEEYASKAVERAVREYAVDNAGWCRFHRRWVEKILPDLYKVFHGVSVDPYDNARRFYRKIIEYQVKAGAKPVLWDSSRVVEIITNAACEHGSSEWCEKFRRNLDEASREWWSRFLKYVKEYFDAPELEVV